MTPNEALIWLVVIAVVLLIPIVYFARKKVFDVIVSSRNQEMILANISTVFGAAFIVYIVNVLISISEAPISLQIIVSLYLIYFLVIGAVISFLIFWLMKKIFM